MNGWDFYLDDDLDDGIDDWGSEGPPVRHYDCTVVHSTPKALKLKIPERVTEFWAARSLLEDLNRGPDGVINTLSETGQTGTVFLPSWLESKWMEAETNWRLDQAKSKE